MVQLRHSSHGTMQLRHSGHGTQIEAYLWSVLAQTYMDIYALLRRPYMLYI